MRVKNRLIRNLLLLFSLALAVRLLAAWPQQQPNYMDDAYYTVNGMTLVQGRGFVEDFVWNYLDNPDPPPRSGHLYWMPLTSLLAGLGMWLGGASYRAAQMPFVLLSALLPLLSYYVTVRAWGGTHRQGWLAGLLTIFGGFYVPFWSAIDTFAPFGLAGGLALLLGWRGSAARQPQGTASTNRKPWLTMVAAGLCVGLAHLTRADGLLLLVALCLMISSWITQHATRSTQFRRDLFFSLLSLMVGYLLVMTPWFVRNWQVAGVPLPAAGSQTIWLADYDQIFSYGRELSPHTFFGQGAGAVLQGRWWVLITNLQTMLAVLGMIFLAPLALVGGWHLRRHGLMQLAALYALLLFGAMTVVFAFPGARGGLFHSSTALLPFINGAAVIGLEQVISWMATRRRRWNARAARQVFGPGLVGLAIALSSFIYYQRVLKNNVWNRSNAAYPAIAGWVDQHDVDAVVMIGNPPAYRYHGGGLSVVVPNENLETTLAAARQYGVRYLVLDQNRPQPLAEVYQNPVDQAPLLLRETFEHTVYLFEIVGENQETDGS